MTLAGASLYTWTDAGPRLAMTAASAATRHRSPAARTEAADALRVSVPPSPALTPPAAPPSRRARAPEPEPDRVSIDVPDLPEPPPQSPLLWDDLFPARPRPPNGAPAPALAPCFDRLQGIEGLSPCPAVTPR